MSLSIRFSRVPSLNSATICASGSAKKSKEMYSTMCGWFCIVSAGSVSERRLTCLIWHRESTSGERFTPGFAVSLTVLTDKLSRGCVSGIDYFATGLVS